MFTAGTVNEHLHSIPHAKALGLQCYSVEGNEVDEGYIELVLPYADHLIGDPDTGVVHGGAITALLDNAAGFMARPGVLTPDAPAIATLDLRIDYLRPAVPGRDIIARAVRVKATTKIIFVQAKAFDRSIDDPVALCTAAFMVGTPNKKIG